MAKRFKLQQYDNKEFVARRSPMGFGYEIITGDTFKRLYHTSEKEELVDVVEKLEGGALFDELPAGKNQWVPKLLIKEEKHFTQHYLINNEEELFKIALEIIQEDYENNAYSWMEETNQPDAPVFTEEDLNNIPIPMKKDAENILERYRKDLKSYNEIKASYNNLLNILKKKESKSAWHWIVDYYASFSTHGFRLESFHNYLT